MNSKLGTAIVAVGGNALIIDNEHKTVPDQFEAAAIAMGYVADMVAAGWNVVITHGNGPQVGYILRRSELALHELHPVPMDYAGADTQGAIGYMFQKALRNEFRRRGIEREVVSVVTQVRVERDDPAFAQPSKPIGSFMDRQTAEGRALKLGWRVCEDAGRGWRRVVPSPRPVEVMELAAIRTLTQAGFVVVACGGGGIPVIEKENGKLRGVEAVIDKDYASSLLAQQLQADLFLITTSVEKVALHYGDPDERWLDRATLTEARDYYAAGHFPAGSMGPKMTAIIDYLTAGGERGLITDPANIGRALSGENGTTFVPD
ncbi:MAG TPA: carbamate kinase [Anaerolineales bacterium]|nr:carbamate kinase [Anaerolineales bacterium]